MISIVEIRNKIINYKTIKEKKEALEYHSERWETISSKYFRSFEITNHSNNNRLYYSYVLDNKYYVSEADRNLDFYNETGISYQVRDLLLDLISYPPSSEWYKTGICKRSIIKIMKEYRKDIICDDYNFYNLSEQILKKIKQK